MLLQWSLNYQFSSSGDKILPVVQTIFLWIQKCGKTKIKYASCNAKEKKEPNVSYKCSSPFYTQSVDPKFYEQLFWWFGDCLCLEKNMLHVYWLSSTLDPVIPTGVMHLWDISKRGPNIIGHTSFVMDL